MFLSGVRWDDCNPCPVCIWKDNIVLKKKKKKAMLKIVFWYNASLEQTNLGPINAGIHSDHKQSECPWKSGSETMFNVSKCN